jgi:DNA-binding MarR family transcriptional regulator
MRADQRRRRIAVSEERLPSRHNRFSDRRALDAWSVLITFFSLIDTAVAAVREPVKLSNDELLVLTCLAHAGDTLSMGEIERSSFLQTGRVRRAVDTLETRRLLAWRRSRADRRKVLVRMTKAGGQLTDTLSTAMFELVRNVAEPIGQEATEFMRAKMRKIISSAGAEAAAILDGMYADDRYDGPVPLAPDAASMPAVRSARRPATWGLAGWLRCCQWSSQVDRVSRKEFRNLGLTAPRLQVLAALERASEAMTADAIASASATGLPRALVTSTLSALERAGLVARSSDRAQPRATRWKLTERGEQKVLEAWPVANTVAEHLYRGLSDEDLARVLSILPRLCSSAWEAREHYGAARSLTSTPSTQ